MNRYHRRLCRSAKWRKRIEPRMAWVLDGLELGPEVLEVGPGPGLTTDRLKKMVTHVTAIEIDPDLADSLSRRMQGSNVTVIKGDASSIPFEEAMFSASFKIARFLSGDSEWRETFTSRTLVSTCF